jgi:hypothetical protein
MNIDSTLASNMSPFRKFRHVALHGYGFQMEWDRMADGIAKGEEVFSKFRENLENYLKTL